MTSDQNRRYADWHNCETQHTDHATPAEAAPFTQNVVVMPEQRRGRSPRWQGVFAIDDHDSHEEFHGTKDEVITWARTRCDEVWIWSEAEQDLELLRGP